MSEANLEQPAAAAPSRKTPITLLSGFLGAGKTTLLREMLQNKEGLRIGIVVNDVAAVNIDAKLMKGVGGGGSAPDDTVELQNGCACCSAAEEFMQAIDKLVELAERRGVPYDHIVVESTGVAEPNEVRSIFQRSAEAGEELMDKVTLRTLVTVVDASTFVDLFDCSGRVMERPELGEDDGVSNVQRKVVELLVEQVETADVLVLNKADQLADAAQLETLRQMVGAMNPLARSHVTEWGKLPLSHVLGAAGGAAERAAERDQEGDLRRQVKRLREAHAHAHGEHGAEPAPKAGRAEAGGHAHGHAGHAAPAEPEGHAGGHAHSGHGHAAHANGHEAGHVHGHAHKGGEAEGAPCAEAACADLTHAHAHAGGQHAAHAHGGGAAECKDKSCADPSHAHAHGHGHGHAHGHASIGRHAERFGISSFVYARRRPFHPQRLVESAIQQLPAKTNLALKEQLQAPPDPASPFAALVRSKGFLWLSNNHLETFYWAHAGSHFEVKKQGLWWATIDQKDWPPEDAADIAAEMAPTYGDRRQELVFIGIGLDEAALTAKLDSCLLTDAEMLTYKTHWATQFPNDAINTT